MSASEWRTDPLSGERVVIAPGRAERPGAWGELVAPDAVATAASCPFCEGRESETPPEVYALGDPARVPDSPGWRARLVPNKYPALSAQDVGVHTPQHRLSIAELSAAELDNIVALWRWRATTGRRSDTVYTHVAVNEGRAAGASLAHTHSQVFSLPTVPPRVAEELTRQADAGACLVCAMIADARADGPRVVAEDNGVVAFCPYASRFAHEIVITPVACEPDVFASALLPDALGLASGALSALRAHVGWAPVNLWLVTSPTRGPETHWRLVMAPRLTTPAGLELGAGITVNPVDPASAAATLRAERN